jgi:hypothetical protein
VPRCPDNIRPTIIGGAILIVLGTVGPIVLWFLYGDGTRWLLPDAELITGFLPTVRFRHIVNVAFVLAFFGFVLLFYALSEAQRRKPRPNHDFTLRH